MYKYMKIVAIVVMVVMAGVSSPAIGQAAGNASIKATCTDFANSIARKMAQTGDNQSTEVLAEMRDNFRRSGGKVLSTDTELLLVAPTRGNPVVQVQIDLELREVRVEMTLMELHETASAKY